MQRLVEIIAQLRSSAIGGATDQPPHPEALTLYVLEEAQDVLEALHTVAQAIDQAIDHTVDQDKPLNQPMALPQSRWQGYFRLSSLVPWLLWGTVRSSDQVMQLMEGRTARLQIDRTWQTGMLRLMPLLSFSATDAVHTIDLATGDLAIGTSCGNPLAADRLIDFDSPLGQSPVTVTALLNQLNSQIQATTAAIVPFLQGIPAELLMPQSPWQTGSIQLHYQLEFIPTSISPLLLSPSPLPTPASPPPCLKFTDSTWLKQYQSIITQQQLTRLLSERTNGLSEESVPSLPSLVAAACQVSEQIQTGLAIISRRFVTEELSLSQLAMRLHWCLIHSAYEVMQLLSGIPATVWLPQSTCQTGTLRFSIHLRMQTPQLEWILDLATGQSLAAPRSPLSPGAIGQSYESQWCTQPISLAHLEKTLWQQVHQSIPEIKLLLQGAEVDLLENGEMENGQAWQPGVMQLQGNFEFKDEG